MGEQEVTMVPASPREFRIIRKKWVILGFVLVISALFFFAFSDSSITGNAVRDTTTDTPSPGIKVSAEVGRIALPLESRQSISKISLGLKGSSAKLYVGRDGVTDLSQLTSADVLMNDFDGTISFDADNLLVLKGSVSKISINGLPTASATGEISVRIEEPMQYETLELNGMYIASYNSLEESGKVSFNDGKVTLQLDQEPFLLEEFSGSLKSGLVGKQGILRQGLNLDGFATNVEVGGDFNFNLYK